MAVPSVTNTFSNNTTADASEVNTNFSDLVTYLSDRNDGSATWDRCLVTNASAVPMVVNNSTGTQNIVQFQDNGSVVLVIEDGGHTTVTCTHASNPTLTANNGTSTGAIFRARDNGTTVFQILDGGLMDYVIAPIALGGGASATLGTIGGSGPATETQNSWVKCKINGTDSYIPIWR